MTIFKLSTIALAGTLALALSVPAIAQVGGGTELPSSAKQAQPADQSGSPANRASNGGAGSSGAMQGDMKKDGGAMTKDGGAMTK